MSLSPAASSGVSSRLEGHISGRNSRPQQYRISRQTCLMSNDQLHSQDARNRDQWHRSAFGRAPRKRSRLRRRTRGNSQRKVSARRCTSSRARAISPGARLNGQSELQRGRRYQWSQTNGRVDADATERGRGTRPSAFPP